MYCLELTYVKVSGPLLVEGVSNVGPALSPSMYRPFKEPRNRFPAWWNQFLNNYAVPKLEQNQNGKRGYVSGKFYFMLL
jgi:hypothetical protein